jgi:hypothetical protein
MVADLEFASHILLLSATPAALPDEFFRTCTAGFGRRCVPLRTEGLRVPEATEAGIEAMWAKRGHGTLVITRKGGKVVTIPLAPRTARAIDLAIGERLEGRSSRQRTGRGWTGGTEPTVTLLRRLAAALDADVRVTAGDDLGSAGFEAHAA